ncbi:variant SH3 domain protein [Teladorsagia circumcincta]|uniref:Variant SH3 domain protein n=1 Tax=Teladorsagia circumcincta TaxID=45464 RepID=A0A2G9UJM2_TELCI|nr:variant SH3 domain protein [Teladorsagia circumcincta]
MGNAVMARSLLNNKSVWIDEEDGRGRTALHYAMEQDSFEIVEVLVNGGANLDCVDFHGTSACHLACKEGKIDALELMMIHRADPFCVDKAGKTPFDLACEFGMEKIVCRLLENGWDVNRTTVLGTALHEASGYGRAQVVRFLLHAGINSSLTNASGLTALEYAKKNAHRNPITIKEIRFLLKECKNFVYGQAVEQHLGTRADELSFDEGDLVWIIDRRHSPEGRWKGVVFGRKGNSRSGHFQSSAVKIIDKPESGSQFGKTSSSLNRHQPQKVFSRTLQLTLQLVAAADGVSDD